MFTIVDLFQIPFSFYFVIVNTIIIPIYTKQDNNHFDLQYCFRRNMKSSSIKMSMSGSATHIKKDVSQMEFVFTEIMLLHNIYSSSRMESQVMHT